MANEALQFPPPADTTPDQYAERINHHDQGLGIYGLHAVQTFLGQEPGNERMPLIDCIKDDAHLCAVLDLRADFREIIEEITAIPAPEFPPDGQTEMEYANSIVTSVTLDDYWEHLLSVSRNNLGDMEKAARCAHDALDFVMANVRSHPHLRKAYNKNGDTLSEILGSDYKDRPVISAMLAIREQQHILVGGCTS